MTVPKVFVLEGKTERTQLAASDVSASSLLGGSVALDGTNLGRGQHQHAEPCKKCFPGKVARS